MEVFTRYRRYFALLVAAPPYILAVPVALRLRARPLHALSLMLMLVMYCRRDTSFADVVFLVAAVTALHADTIFSDSKVHPVDKSGDAAAEVGERADTARDKEHAQQQQQQQQARPVKEGAVTYDAAGVPAPTEAAEIVFIAADSHAPTVGMRFLPLITLGVAVPMAVSGTMLHLWTTVGTGNANFLFFQGLVMWVFLATGMLHCTSSNGYMQKQANKIVSNNADGFPAPVVKTRPPIVTSCPPRGLHATVAST
jgi:GPI transamidase subunit PIG-U